MYYANSNMGFENRRLIVNVFLIQIKLTGSVSPVRQKRK